MNNKKYDHLIAVDWSQNNMVIAHQKGMEGRAQVLDRTSSVYDLQLFLKNLKGSILITFEESTGSQWLYTSLKPYVTEVIVCDPYRNKLLTDGAKTDRVDALKLLELLRGGFLKPGRKDKTSGLRPQKKALSNL